MKALCKHQEEPWLSHLVEDSYHPDCKQLLFLLHSPASPGSSVWLPAQSPGQHTYSKSTHFSEQMATTASVDGSSPHLEGAIAAAKLGAQMAPPWKDAHWKVWFPSQRTMGSGSACLFSFNWSEDIHFLCWHPMLGRQAVGKGARRGTEVQSRGEHDHGRTLFRYADFLAVKWRSQGLKLRALLSSSLRLRTPSTPLLAENSPIQPSLRAHSMKAPTETSAPERWNLKECNEWSKDVPSASTAPSPPPGSACVSRDAHACAWINRACIYLWASEVCLPHAWACGVHVGKFTDVCACLQMRVCL